MNMLHWWQPVSHIAHAPTLPPRTPDPLSKQVLGLTDRLGGGEVCPVTDLDRRGAHGPSLHFSDLFVDMVYVCVFCKAQVYRKNTPETDLKQA